MVTISADFNKIRSHTKIFKLVNTFNLFINIINYWCSVNKQVIDDFFSLLPTFNHYVYKKITRDRFLIFFIVTLYFRGYLKKVL